MFSPSSRRLIAEKIYPKGTNLEDCLKDFQELFLKEFVVALQRGKILVNYDTFCGSHHLMAFSIQQ